jgi:hypothetical protein
LGRFAERPIDRDLAKVYESNFAWKIGFAPDGRLVCLLGDPRTLAYSPSLVGVSRQPLRPDQRPELRCLTSVEIESFASSTQHTFPYLKGRDGQTIGPSCQPRPTLADQAKQKFAMSLYCPWVSDLYPLDDSRYFVSAFHKLMRGGTKGCTFLFAILSEEGELIGRLEGIDQWRESPFVGHRYKVVVE